MAASLSIVPSGQGNTPILAKTSACRISVTGADQNDVAGYDDPPATIYPTMPEIQYYIHLDGPGTDDMRSHVFGVDENGGHTWDNVVFSQTGTWTIRLRKTNDTDVASLAVPVT